MPLITTFAGLTARAFGFGGNRPGLYDNFLRTTSPGTLGNAVTGQTWINATGSWYANGSEAETDLVLPPQSISYIPFKTDTTISLFDVTPDNGIIFWLIDENNWYGAIVFVGIIPPHHSTTILLIQYVDGSQTLVAETYNVLTPEDDETWGIHSIQVETSGDDIVVTGFTDGSCVTPASGDPTTWTYSGPKGTGVGIGHTTGGDDGGLLDGTTVGPFTAI